MTATSEEPVTWAELTSDELRQLDRQLPVVVPMGLVESHGPALTLGFDNDSAEHFARVACARAGAVLMPTMPYGFADEFREYPGTVGVSMDTLGHVVADLCAQIRRHGFHKIVFLAGHGANVRASQLGFERAWTRHPDLKLACWTWWGVVDLPIHHADEVETSFALLLGRTVHLDRAQDAVFVKPWHSVRSRWESAPDTGGVNGSPSKASAASVEADYRRIMDALVARLRQARQDTAITTSGES